MHTNKKTLTLPPDVVSHYNQLKSNIDGANDLDLIVRCCDVAAGLSGDSIFSFIFAAILLAKKGEHEKAIDLLKPRTTKSPFALAFKRYLSINKGLRIKAKVFDSATAYNAWCRTEFYKEYNRAAVAEITKSILNTALPNNEAIILDVGSGNGILITNIINSILAAVPLTSLHLILNDASQNMLELAKLHCKQNINLPLTITTIKGRIEDISPDVIQAATKNTPVWFVNGAASLHHMPAAKKHSTLKKLASLTYKILITDFEANHDLPQADTPEFLYSLVQNQNFFIEDILLSNNSEDDKWLAIDEFILAEGLVMIANDREHRVDYHAHKHEWIDLVNKAGLTVCDERFVFHNKDGRPITFYLDLSSKLAA